MHGAIDEVLRTDSAIDWTKRVRAGRQLVYFCPEVTDASTLKRVQQFIDHGFDVTVFGFHRARYNTDYRPAWPHVPLGTTVDGRYWHRLRALLGAIPAILRSRKKFTAASHFYARNIDQLLLALLAKLIAGTRAPVVYEVLDIPAILMKRGPVTALLRAIERLCLRRVRLLVVSSPAFHRDYFMAVQKYGGPWFLLENKLHASIARFGRAAPRTAARGGKPWVVGYFGLIRGEDTFALMTRLAERLQGRIEFRFRGVLTTVGRDGFDAALKRLPNMSYGGAYVPHEDLEALYREVDFAWALDLEHTDHNSRWLLPCRFYEAGYFGVPCLAVRGFEVGALLERHGIGFTFGAPLEEELFGFFEALTTSDYERTRRRLGTMPASIFVAGDDMARLCGLLDALSAAPRD